MITQRTATEPCQFLVDSETTFVSIVGKRKVQLTALRIQTVDGWPQRSDRYGLPRERQPIGCFPVCIEDKNDKLLF